MNGRRTSGRTSLWTRRHAMAHAEKEVVITLDEYQVKLARGDG